MDVAIIGMSCRFPGHSNDVDSFWNLLYSGRDGITSVASRWGTSPSLTNKYGGFIDNVDSFDASFFNILPKEALKMDPQHRLLLELHWEALESACIPADEMKGSETGVFVGITWNDYEVLLQRHMTESTKPKDYHDLYLSTGTTHAIAPGRISFYFDLKGPALCVDTACSSSLVALHCGCTSLQAGESEMAFVSGINLVLIPTTSTNFTQAGMLNDHCRTFDKMAKGYARSEGGAVVLLKRLSDALRDSNEILGVIKGTAINQDGRSAGITAPSKVAQERVYKMAMQRAGLVPDDVQYIEAHGTGTILGDKTELESISAFYGRNGGPNIGIGSVKTNIGHTESTAGLAGLLKLVLSLQNEYIPPHINFKEATPSVEQLLNKASIEILCKGKLWPRVLDGKPRIGAVSSFGFSGTNAHAIVQEAPLKYCEEDCQFKKTSSLQILTFSSKTKNSLDQMLISYEKYLKDVVNVVDWLDITYTSNTARTHFVHNRFALVAKCTEEALKCINEGIYSAGINVTNVSDTKLYFIFTGTNSVQLVSMGLNLCTSLPLFKVIVNECETIVKRCGGIFSSAFKIFDKGLDTKKYGHLIAFILEYTIAKCLIEVGIIPEAVICYGTVAEYVGAVISGVISLVSALKLVIAHSQLIELAHVKSFGIIRITEGQHFVNTFLQKLNIQQKSNHVVQFLNDGDKETILCSEADSITQIIDSLKPGQANILHEFDSPDTSVGSFKKVAMEIEYKMPTTEIQFVSATKGHIRDKIIGSDYWTSKSFNHQPNVNFHNKSHTIFVGTQNEMFKWKSAESTNNGLLINSQDTFYKCLAKIYTIGFTINFKVLHKGTSAKFIQLPKYAFDRKVFWYPQIPLCYGSTMASPKSTPVNVNPIENKALVDNSKSVEIPVLTSILKTKANLVDDQSAGINFSLEYLDSLERSMPKWWSTSKDEAYNLKFDQLCMNYVFKAFMQFKVQEYLHGKPNLYDLAMEIGVHEKHRILFEYLVGKLAVEGFINQSSANKTLSLGTPFPVSSISEAQANIDSKLKALKNLDPSRDALLGLTHVCASDLVPIMKGEKDPLKYLFPGSRRSEYSADRYYTDAPDLMKCNELVQKIIEEGLDLTHVGSHGTIRIVEIGAGTGSTTMKALKGLQRHTWAKVEYTFTDISGVFFPNAKKKLPASSDKLKMHYKVCNVENDVIEQGFEPESFDIAIASNVFHATKNIRQSVGTVKALLKPAGYLILCERTQLCLALDLTFGLTNGWWRFKGNDPYRVTNALMSQHMWSHLFETSGFEDTLCIGFPETIIIGRKVSSKLEGMSVMRKSMATRRSESFPHVEFSTAMEIHSDKSVTEEKAKLILTDILSQVTKLEIGEIDGDKEFGEIGLDSLMTAEFESKLASTFNIQREEGVRLSTRYPTIKKIANFVATNYIVM